MSILRISRLIAIFAGAAVLIAAWLCELMVDQHETWKERSYMNRWAFRDVPTRRGSILVGRGAEQLELSYDVPTFDLELRYREFRRGHPVGAALHGANLLRRAYGVDARYDFARPGLLRGACRDLLRTPVAILARPELDRDVARDLRFYASALVASLTGADMSRISLVLWRAVNARLPGTILDAVTSEVCKVGYHGDPYVEFDRRLDELEDLAERLRRAHPDLDMWARLEEYRRDALSWRDLSRLPPDQRECLVDPEFWRYAAVDLPFWEWPGWRTWLKLPEARRSEVVESFLRRGDAPEPELDEYAVPPRFIDEARARPLCRRIPYRTAAWLGLLRERHPGFVLQPAVHREQAPLPGRDDRGALGVWIGRATEYWATDDERILDDRTEPVFGGLDSSRLFAGQSEWWSPELEDSMWRGARATVRRYFRSRGRLGRSGVEGAMDGELSGVPGLRWVEHSKRTRERRMFVNLDVSPGRDVELTVDLSLQALVESVVLELGQSPERAMVVLDARSGDILAVAGRSLRRPRKGEPAPGPEWSYAPFYPSYNPTVGSVIKPFVMLEFLAQAAARPAEVRSCSAFAECQLRYMSPLSRRELRCDDVHNAVARDPVQALGKSCNVFFFQAVEAIGAPGLAAALARVGWNGGVVEGDWHPARGIGYQATPRHERAARDLEMQGIGYGVMVSVAQVARAYAGLATGWLPTLSIVRDAVPRERVPLAVDPGHLAVVRAGLRACVDSGTAARIGELQSFGVFGKTGTAEVVSKKGSDSDLNNAWFAGYLGQDEAATLAFAAVAYRDPGHGADVAGQMVADVLTRIAGDPALAGRYLGGGK